MLNDGRIKNPSINPHQQATGHTPAPFPNQMKMPYTLAIPNYNHPLKTHSRRDRDADLPLQQLSGVDAPAAGLADFVQNECDAIRPGFVEGQLGLGIAWPDLRSGPSRLVRKLDIDGGVGPCRDFIALEVEHGLHGLADPGRCRDGHVTAFGDGSLGRTCRGGRGRAGVCGQGSRGKAEKPHEPGQDHCGDGLIFHGLIIRGP